MDNKDCKDCPFDGECIQGCILKNINTAISCQVCLNKYKCVSFQVNNDGLLNKIAKENKTVLEYLHIARAQTCKDKNKQFLLHPHQQITIINTEKITR